MGEKQKRIKRRGNGQGYVIKKAPGNWKAIVTLGYKDGDYGKPVRRTKSGFPTKTAALEYIVVLKQEQQKRIEEITLKEAFDRWLPTHNAGKSTINCYKAGFKIFEDCWYLPMNNQDIDELQACLDECANGRRTRENAKACLGLIYKWAIPRGLVENKLNLAQYLNVGDGEAKEKHAFTKAQLDIIESAIGVVPFADYIYCHCYLGFRPSAFLGLQVQDYNDEGRYFVGGTKTDAGKNRIVTVSPKIQQLIDGFIAQANGGYIFGLQGKRLNIQTYRAKFYEVLATLKIQVLDDHTLTPHCCRHTFATLMKGVEAPDKDKMRLIGHSSAEQLRYYQDVVIEDLRRITDKL